VSWQSAFWGLLALQLATVIQNSGAVLGQSYSMRISLRSSPILCALDNVIVIVKVAALLYGGYSWRTACHHVWWDRFPKDDEGEESGLDGSWALNMWAFILGALPQAIKIYGMRGIPLTQALATIFLVSFITMETIRITAGPLDNEKLQTIPNVATTKRWIARITFVVAVTGELCQLIVWNLILPCIIPDQPFWWPTNDAAVIVLLMVSTFLFTICAVATPLITLERWYDVVMDLMPSPEDPQLRSVGDRNVRTAGNSDRLHRSSIELIASRPARDQQDQKSATKNISDATHRIAHTAEEVERAKTDNAMSLQISHRKVHEDDVQLVESGMNCPDR
jgi:hypothetical protein